MNKKKIISLLLTLICFVFISGCQSKSNKKNVELERLNSLNDLKIIVLKIDNEEITRKIFW